MVSGKGNWEAGQAACGMKKLKNSMVSRKKGLGNWVDGRSDRPEEGKQNEGRQNKRRI